MTGTLILVAAGLLLAAVLLRAARGQGAAVRSLQELEGHTQPVDLAGLRNLIDPAEEEFLRRRLSPAQFRAVERQRLRAAAEYVQRAAHNAAILLHLGEAVAQRGDPEAAAAAREMADNALRLRINAFLALGVLYTRVVFPEARISLRRVTETYQNLTEGVLRLSRLQNPTYQARISAVI